MNFFDKLVWEIKNQEIQGLIANSSWMPAIAMVVFCTVLLGIIIWFSEKDNFQTNKPD